MNILSNIERKIIILLLSCCLIFPLLSLISVLPTENAVYAGTYSQNVEFTYKKGYSVEGRSNSRFHYLKAGKPTLKLSALSGATSASPVKISLYTGNTYKGSVSAKAKGSFVFPNSVTKGSYWLKISGGAGVNGWITGKGTITPVYQ